MSSHVTLYSNSASKETVDKSGSLTTIEAMTGDFRGSMSILKAHSISNSVKNSIAM